MRRRNLPERRHCEGGALTMAAPFAMVPLGPRNDADGRWCCGLRCGRPCPYGLKLKSKGRAAEQ